MASQLYPSARESFLTAQLSWLVGDYRLVVLPEAYSLRLSDTMLSDISAGSRIALSDIVANKSATNGYAKCDPVHFGVLVDSRKADKLVVYKDTGDETTSPLVAFIDSDEIFGTPVSLVGLDYFFVPDNATGALFRL